jgi:hypothetical protein
MNDVARLTLGLGTREGRKVILLSNSSAYLCAEIYWDLCWLHNVWNRDTLWIKLPRSVDWYLVVLNSSNVRVAVVQDAIQPGDVSPPSQKIRWRLKSVGYLAQLVICEVFMYDRHHMIICLDPWLCSFLRTWATEAVPTYCPRFHVRENIIWNSRYQTL